MKEHKRQNAIAIKRRKITGDFGEKREASIIGNKIEKRTSVIFRMGGKDSTFDAFRENNPEGRAE